MGHTMLRAQLHARQSGPVETSNSNQGQLCTVFLTLAAHVLLPCSTFSHRPTKQQRSRWTNKHRQWYCGWQKVHTSWIQTGHSTARKQQKTCSNVQDAHASEGPAKKKRRTSNKVSSESSISKIYCAWGSFGKAMKFSADLTTILLISNNTSLPFAIFILQASKHSQCSMPWGPSCIAMTIVACYTTSH